jgi:hypothetical protein
MGLRRYCRTLVAEAKAALPDLDTGDPLTGTIVDEDASASYTGGGSSGNTGASAVAPPAPNLRTVNPVGDNSGGMSQSGTGPRAIRDNTDGRGWSSGGATPSTVTPPPERRGGSKAIWIIAIGIVLLVAGTIVVAGVFGLSAAVIFGSGEIASGDDDTTVVEAPKPATPTPTPPPVPTGPVGSKILSPDTRTGIKKVPTVLTYSDAAGGTVELKGPGGFKAEWDGKAPFDLGPTGEGAYQATVTTANGTKHRLKRFTIESKGKCAFSFDAAEGEWKGKCE